MALKGFFRPTKRAILIFVVPCKIQPIAPSHRRLQTAFAAYIALYNCLLKPVNKTQAGYEPLYHIRAMKASRIIPMMEIRAPAFAMSFVDT